MRVMKCYRPTKILYLSVTGGHQIVGSSMLVKHGGNCTCGDPHRP